ncbi:type IV secretion protein Rhs, partial [Arachnia propionica]
MSDVMQGISEDVQFNHEHADALITACNDAADTVENQTASRSSWLSHGLEDFSGYYAQLFQQNGSVQASDASLLVTRLREVVKAVQDLKASAKAEQERRQTARDWKKRQEDRGWWDHVTDWFTGGEAPPMGPPDPAPTFSVTPVTPPERQPLTGSGHTGTSSARPANLRSFATNSSGGNDELRPKATTASTAYSNFTGSCKWGSLSASGVFTGFDSYIAANDNDVSWANVVAGAFEAAGGDGVVTVANA